MPSPDELFDLLLGRPGTPLDRAKLRPLLDEAAAACPAGHNLNSGPDLLPRSAETGKCRLCGQVRPLTREHIPPRSAGNLQTARSHSMQEWLDRIDLDSLPGGTHEQGGIWGYTLCTNCNSATGRRYGSEYRDWSARAHGIISQIPDPETIDAEVEPQGVTVEFRDVRPGAFVRQVLSCMCSLSVGWDLAATHPTLRPIIVDGAPGALPDGVHVGVELFLGPHSRMVGPQLKFDASTGLWAWVMEFAHPPFACQMVLATNDPEPDVGLVMNPFVAMDPSEETTLTADFLVGFGWTAIPGDYRSSAAIKAQRG